MHLCGCTCPGHEEEQAREFPHVKLRYLEERTWTSTIGTENYFLNWACAGKIELNKRCLPAAWSSVRFSFSGSRLRVQHVHTKDLTRGRAAIRSLPPKLLFMQYWWGFSNDKTHGSFLMRWDLLLHSRISLWHVLRVTPLVIVMKKSKVFDYI